MDATEADIAGVKEAEFKKWFRKMWEGSGRWLGAIEYALGGDEGYADLTPLVDASSLIPAELKVGWIDNGLVKPREVRPAQVMWHRDLWTAGGRSYLLIGVPIIKRDDWLVFGIEGNKINSWREGFRIGTQALTLTGGPEGTADDINDYLAGRWHE